MENTSNDRALTETEVLQNRLLNANAEISRLHGANGAMVGEIIFWKKLALSQLGVDSQKVNELVHSGAGLGGATLSRGSY